MFFKHPAKVCMTYMQHCKFSLKLGYIFGKASTQAIVHAFLPDTFITSSTDTVKLVSDKLKKAGC